MKKLILLLVIVCLSLPFQAMATTGSITGVSSKIYDINGTFKYIKVLLTCTADVSAHTYPATVINDLVTDKIVGMSLYTVGTYPGSTAPTDATDLTITQDTIDILDTKGVNLIDATTKEITWAGSSTQDFAVPIVGDITANITNNSVDSAVSYIVLIFGE